MKKLSVVLPAYNEEKNIENTAKKLGERFKSENIDYELVFVDDGSKDNSWQILKELANSDRKVAAVHFSRNFGKEGAIFAGLKAASGDAVIVMDCDLQHPIDTAVEMFRLWENNDIDVVEAKKRSRGNESLLYKGFAKLFYKLLKSTANLDLNGASDFKLLSKEVVDCLLELPERVTFFRALSSWVGFKTETIYFDVASRTEGKTKWSKKSLFKFAINSITSFSNLPMQIVTFCGIFFFVFAVILGINTLFNYFTGYAEVGFSTVILLILITGGIIMFALGIFGFYLSKIYEEIKFRPRYIVSEKINVTEKHHER